MEYIRNVCTSLAMAELCKKLLYLWAQFNMAEFGEATLGWIDSACHCFSSSHWSCIHSRVLSVSVTVLRNHTAWICHSGFRARSITFQAISTETLK